MLDSLLLLSAGRSLEEAMRWVRGLSLWAPLGSESIISTVKRMSLVSEASVLVVSTVALMLP